MFIAFVLSRIRAYRLYRASLRDLSRFSDRELVDLGLSRYEIGYELDPGMERRAPWLLEPEPSVSCDCGGNLKHGR